MENNFNPIKDFHNFAKTYNLIMRHIYFAIATIFIAMACEKTDPVVAKQTGFKPLLDTEGDSLTNHKEYIDYASITIYDPNQEYNENELYLNGQVLAEDVIEITQPGFYELMQISEDEEDVKIDTTIYEFVVLNSERPEDEWGLPTFTPSIPYLVSYQPADINAVYYKNKVSGVESPFLVTVADNGVLKSSFANITVENEPSGTMKHGAYASLFTASNFNSTECQVGANTITLEQSNITPTAFSLPAEISEDITVPANSYIKAPASIIIKAGATVTINEGVLMNMAGCSEITLEGDLVVVASSTNPVLFTSNDGRWGGFISEGGNMTAQGAIFTGSNGKNDTGLTGRQALFTFKNGGTLSLIDCYAIKNYASIIDANDTDISIDNSYFISHYAGMKQDGGSFSMTNSYISDIHVGELKYTTRERDALHLSGVDATIDGSKILFIADDAISCGSNGPASVEIKNSYIGYTIHEGVKTTSNTSIPNGSNNISLYNVEIENCGQGIELGGGAHDNFITADECTLSNNLIGVRYGHSDTTEVSGAMVIKNCTIKDSYHMPIWNKMPFEWKESLNSILFENISINQKSAQYPEL